VREGSLPRRGEKACKRRLIPLPGKEKADNKAQRHIRESEKTSVWHAFPVTGSPCTIPGTCMESTHRKPIAAGNQKTSLLVPGHVNDVEIGRSCPISTACRLAWRTTRLVDPQGYATSQNHATSISHAFWPLWHPLEL
jgi:hypothetical protein